MIRTFASLDAAIAYCKRSGEYVTKKGLLEPSYYYAVSSAARRTAQRGSA